MKDYTQQIENNYKSYEVTDEQADTMRHIRQLCFGLAANIDKDLPDSREKSIALTKLEEVMFWSNAGIARGAKND